MTIYSLDELLFLFGTSLLFHVQFSNTFLNNQQVTEEVKGEIKKFLETNDNENMTTQNLWETAKAVLRGKFKAMQSYLKEEEKHRIDNLTLHLKQLEEEEQKKKTPD